MWKKLSRKQRVAAGAAGAAVVVLAVLAVARPPSRKRIRENEARAVASLKAYLSAQNMFHRSDRYGIGKKVYANARDGTGFPDLHKLGGTGSDGEELRLIDVAFSRAQYGAPGAKPKDGYLFVDFPPVAPEEYCGLIAIPAEYGRTGRQTFVIDIGGTVYNHDTAGKVPSVKPWLREYEEPPEAPVPPVESVEVPMEDLRALAAGELAFAADLYRELAGREGSDFVFSPYGIYTALAMCYAGARGGTKEAMEKTLHVARLGELGTRSGTFHAAFQALIHRLFTMADWEEVTVHQANALWVHETLKAKAPFEALLSRHYGASPAAVDFRDPSKAAATINRWTEDNTAGRIPEIIRPEELGRAALFVLTNAVYFRGEWSAKFRKEKTEDEPFTRADGSSVEVQMMKQSGRFSCGEAEGVQVIMLPYVGDELDFVVLLPRTAEAMARLEKGLTAELLTRLFRAVRPREGEVWLPRFSIETGLALNDVLAALGMGVAFTSAADFTGIWDLDALWVVDARQKALIEVDEEGTVAVSASWIVMWNNGDEPFTFHADRPFIFLVTDAKLRAVLFMGRVADPAGR